MGLGHFLAEIGAPAWLVLGGAAAIIGLLAYITRHHRVTAAERTATREGLEKNMSRVRPWVLGFAGLMILAIIVHLVTSLT